MLHSLQIALDESISLKCKYHTITHTSSALSERQSTLQVWMGVNHHLQQSRGNLTFLKITFISTIFYTRPPLIFYFFSFPVKKYKKTLLYFFHSTSFADSFFLSHSKELSSLNSVRSFFKRKLCFQTVHSPVDVGSGKVNTVGLDSLFAGSKEENALKVKRLKEQSEN